MAYAYVTLSAAAAVVRRGQLSGLVRLQQPEEKEERYWASLTALSGSQAVLEEHFSDDDVAAMADAVAFATPGVGLLDVTFPIETLEAEYVEPLATALERAGVRLERSNVEMEKRSD